MNKVAFSCLICISSTAFAQTPTQSPVEPTLKSVVVSAPSARQQIEIGGMQQPLNQAPLSATVISSEQIKETGAQRLSDLYKLDASVSDAYNAVGYIDYATVRGFVIDNKTNVRRDGLPISGDTAIGLANKDRVEILRGTSGLQAGTSAPGGLMNYIVKRPTAKPLRQLDMSVDSNGQFGASIDLGGRFGAENAQGYRLNFAASRLNSAAPQTRGSRQMLALALDSRMGSNGLLEAEIEWSKQSQPNVPGLSLLGAGAVLPKPDPKLNLNRQAWSQPTVFEGLTGSLRYTHALSDQWQWSAHLGSQRLKTDDRIAFPFGCTDSNGIDYYADRFCPNGDVDVYDFRSDGERRRKQATQFKLDGSFATGNVSHDISLGFLQSAARVKTPDQVFNYSGSLNLANPLLPIPANPLPAPGTANDQRESTRELFANHRISWSPAFKTWLGLRHTRLQRSDALNATDYSQSFTTPWLAAAYDIQGHTLYASHGHGIESEVVASVNTLNPGQALQPKRSRQTELGIKFNAQSLSWQAALFQISRPVTSADACGSAGISPCNVQLDGSAEHRGLELSAQKSLGALQLGGSATWLDAQRQGSTVDPSINGRKPVNVPSHILRLNAAYRFSQQWQASLHASHEGRRAALPDNTINLPAWTRLDASLKWSTATQGINTTWQLSIDNLLDKRFFKESPYQFGHAYLFPAAPRSLRLLASFAL